MKKKILGAVQLVFGIGLVVFLLVRIDRNTQLVTFQVAGASADQHAVYEDAATPPNRFVVLESAHAASELRCVHTGKVGDAIASTGALNRIEGVGDPSIAWTRVGSVRYGLRFLSDTFRRALRNWPLLLVGSLSFGVCVLLVTWRWFFLLKAQGLDLPFRRVSSLYFVGQFFNSFMPGAVGGDVIKAYFAARRTRHRRTEAVSTIVIDRLIGTMALLFMTAIVTLVFLKFFLSHRETRIALFFNAALLGAAVVGLFAVFRQNVFERWAFFRRLEENTSVGRAIARVYHAFHACLSHTGLLTRCIILSLLNHLMMIVFVCLLGSALEIPMRFWDYLMVFPVINAIAAIPVTPGGLGTREGACVLLLGVLHIPAASAITLSLLVYASTLAWSMIGGLVYITYLYGADPNDRAELQSAIEEAEKEDEPVL